MNQAISELVSEHVSSSKTNVLGLLYLCIVAPLIGFEPSYNLLLLYDVLLMLGYTVL